MESATRDEEKERQESAAKRAREMEEIPFYKIDESQWPRGVRQIAMGETGGLGIDRDGRLYWNGKPVEIISQRLDLTKAQFGIGIVVAVATLITAFGTIVQSSVAYHDWACKVDWPPLVSCPQKPAAPNPADFPG
jgi:hypothetical protein